MFFCFLQGPGENYTDYVATRWYRAPELVSRPDTVTGFKLVFLMKNRMFLPSLSTACWRYVILDAG